MRILGIIPARGGSKGVPRKNIRPLAGKPLLAYTAEAALAAKRLARVILTTDDEEIRTIGQQLGLDAPFLRPPELAEDGTPTLPVIQHALRSLEQGGEYYDAVCILQPTSPFRRPEHIDGCIELLETSGADTVVSVLPGPCEYNPHWVYFRNSEGMLRLSTGESAPISRRQDLPAAFHRDGSVYITRHDVVLKNESLYGAVVVGYPMAEEFSVNIDNLEDFQRATEIAALWQ